MGRILEIFRSKTFIILIILFIVAVGLRFLYFPDNIYFGYDQARDAFVSQELLAGEIKIVGPTTSIPGLNHGAFFYYIFAPIYYLSQFDPSGLSIFLRIYNALGLFLMFLIGSKLFNKRVGLLSALFFAFSYEQTQYALFMTHPALAVLSVLIFYLGLTYLLFERKPYGLPLAIMGFGLSFQFHFLLVYLLIIFVLNLVFFWKRIPRLNTKVIALSIFSLLLTLSTFIVAEVKFGFTASRNLINSVTGSSQEAARSAGGVNGAYLAAEKYMRDNIFAIEGLTAVLFLCLFLFSIYFLRQKEYRDKLIFLLIWFFIGLFSYFVSVSAAYFYGVGTSLSLLLIVSFFLSKLYERSRITTVLIITLVLLSNLTLIIKNNHIGPNPEINVQTGMHLENEKKVIDYIYQKADGKPFAVNAFTMPTYVNTTWAYLFQWYGLKKYGYLPVWGGTSASGYPGNLTINSARTTLPENRFLIIEPVRGIEHLLTGFVTEESYFTDIIEEKRVGEFIVDYQKPK